MSLKQKLTALVSAIIEETEKNEPFRVKIETALGAYVSPSVPQPQWEETTRQKPKVRGTTKQRKGRRTPAVLDPVEIARQGEDVLRDKLNRLTLDQLRDIVAQYGMDPGKLVMKWKDVDRIKDRIVELALARSTKGDAFRND